MVTRIGTWIKGHKFWTTVLVIILAGMIASSFDAVDSFALGLVIGQALFLGWLGKVLFFRGAKTTKVKGDKLDSLTIFD